MNNTLLSFLSLLKQITKIIGVTVLGHNCTQRKCPRDNWSKPQKIQAIQDNNKLTTRKKSQPQPIKNEKKQTIIYTKTKK